MPGGIASYALCVLLKRLKSFFLNIYRTCTSCVSGYGLSAGGASCYACGIANCSVCPT